MPGRPRKWQMVVAGLALLGLAAGAFIARQWRSEAQLLRADPDNLPPALLSFAAGKGRGIFSAHCAQCHGADAKGDRTLGVPDLTDRDWLYGSGRISEVAQTIRYGIRSGNPRGHVLADMPAFAQPRPYAKEALLPLSPDDIQDVTAFLMRLEDLPAPAEAAARGDRIYHTRGACWDCHGQDAKGDNSIGSPNLTDRTWLYGDGSLADIFRSIADGHAGRCPAWVGRLSAAEILETAAFVGSQGGAS
jgi:cytochrome c oxidase cbb3-type subunit III